MASGWWLVACGLPVRLAFAVAVDPFVRESQLDDFFSLSRRFGVRVCVCVWWLYVCPRVVYTYNLCFASA